MSILDRLNRVSYVRTEWVEPHGETDLLMCADQKDEEGVRAVPVNPDGATAAALIIELVAALDGVMPILGRAESNASGNPEWDYVGPRVSAARAAVARARGSGA